MHTEDAAFTCSEGGEMASGSLDVAMPSSPYVQAPTTTAPDEEMNWPASLR